MPNSTVFAGWSRDCGEELLSREGVVSQVRRASAEKNCACGGGAAFAGWNRARGIVPRP